MPKYLTYEQCAAYFEPPLHKDTVYDWLRQARAKVFRSGKARRGNAIVRVRKSVWERLITRNEKRLTPEIRRRRKP